MGIGLVVMGEGCGMSSDGCEESSDKYGDPYRRTPSRSLDSVLSISKWDNSAHRPHFTLLII
jgi:hypothetical protein